MRYTALLVLAIVVFAYWFVTRRKSEGQPAFPSSTIGRASLAVLLVGLIASLVTSRIGVGAPFGLVAFAGALVAFTKQHDRGLALVLPIVVGVLMVAIPLAFWIAG